MHFYFWGSWQSFTLLPYLIIYDLFEMFVVCNMFRVSFDWKQTFCYLKEISYKEDWLSIKQKEKKTIKQRTIKSSQFKYILQSLWRKKSPVKTFKEAPLLQFITLLGDLGFQSMYFEWWISMLISKLLETSFGSSQKMK